MRLLTFIGVPASPWTSFSSFEPSTHGSISEFADCVSTYAPKLIADGGIWIEYSRSAPFSLTPGPEYDAGGPKGHEGKRYCETRF